MAQSLEKAFLQKVAQMPQEELELAPPPPRIKQSKPGRKGKGRKINLHVFSPFPSIVFFLTAALNRVSSSVSGGVTTAHQVPAVSQSAYSPPTPETPDSIMSTPPQTHLTKSLPPVFSTEQSIPAAPTLPPTQPTTKVGAYSGSPGE